MKQNLNRGRGLVLVIDDSSVNLFLTKSLLERIGFDCETCDDPVEGVSKASNVPYTVVLMDIQMPIMDGYTASRRIRDSVGYSLPIIAITAQDPDQVRRNYRDAGMNGYILKPISVDLLDETLRTYAP